MGVESEKTEANSAKKSFTLNVILSFLLLLAVAVIIVLVWNRRPVETPNETSNETTISEQSEPVEKLTDSISIPGFVMLSFKAGELTQEYTIPNPEENTCFFKISLVLSDGTVLWTSDMVAPGENSGNIVLSSPLEEGSYPDAMLKYECFADEAGTQALNGAETNLTIRVK